MNYENDASDLREEWLLTVAGWIVMTKENIENSKVIGSCNICSSAA
jgi:hypothetical protein